MPVYEYSCGVCGERFEVFLRSVAQHTCPACPKCSSSDVRKSISLFGVGGAGGNVAVTDASCGPGPV
jgi:putative FmdB family regulatory protein